MWKILVLFSLVLAYSIIPSTIYKKVWSKGLDSDSVMLTFDDGPSPEYTAELLDLLREHNIRASFFLVTDFARENPELVRRMEEEGHSIGLHSTGHRPILFRGYGYTKRDFLDSMEELKGLGIRPDYYRPPWGQLNLFSIYLAKKHRVKIVMWTLMAADWKKDTSVEYIEKRLLEDVRAGSIICLHDGRGENNAPRRTIDALARVLPSLSQDYSFISLGDYYGEKNR